MQRNPLYRLMCGWLAWPMKNESGSGNFARVVDGCRILTTADELRYVGWQDVADVVADSDGYHWRVPKGWLVKIDFEAEEQSKRNGPEGIDWAMIGG